MSGVVILSGQRTAIGSFMGSLKTQSAAELASVAIKSSLSKAMLNPNDIDEVILGQVLQGGAGQAPARQASLLAGLNSKTPCTTINKVCGSGLKAVMLGCQSILTKESQVLVAGGMESMSQAPYFLKNAREGMRMGHNQMLDLMIHDGLTDPFSSSHMGLFGEKCAKEFSFSRQAQDEYAKKSYEKAIMASKKGWFKDEIAPVIIENKKEKTCVDEDEELSRYMPEKMASLKPVFSAEGTISAANASKINDGAAALVLASEEYAQKNALKPRAKIVAFTTYAAEPEWFTTAPAQAIKKLAAKASIGIGEIELFEINEAFSVVSMHAISELKLDEKKVNVFGGAVALGHPIGCSGARLLVTLLNSLEKNKARLGCVSICLGGGEAVAILVERFC